MENTALNGVNTIHEFKYLEKEIRLGYLPMSVVEVYRSKQQHIIDNTPDRETRKALTVIMWHLCQFDDNDYCSICGLDGRV